MCVGLRRDDLVPEEHEVVYRALERLSDKEMFDRTFRLRRAVQLHMTKESLPPDQQVRLEDDKPYLWRHIDDIIQEDQERRMFDKGQK